MSIRQPAVAGSFYPGDAAAIQKAAAQLAPRQEPVLRGELRGLIAPHAGWRYSGSLLARAVRLLQLYRQEHPEVRLRIIHIGPSHYEHFKGAALSPDTIWRTPLGDTAVTHLDAPTGKGVLRELPGAHAMEHCLEVQLAMLQLLLDDFEYIPLLTGQVDPASLADELEEIRAALGDDKGEAGACIVILVSTDLSHFYPEGLARELDSICNAAIPAVDIERLRSSGELCGKTGVLALMHLARRHSWQGELLGYATSADAGGPRSEVVGYGAYAFWEEQKSASGP